MYEEDYIFNEVMKRAKIFKIYIYISLIAFLIIGALAAIISKPFFDVVKKNTVPIIYIKKPKNLNWVAQTLPEHEAMFSSSLNGLIVKRDTSFDNLSDLNRKILTFPPSGFLELSVGNKKYNIREETDARYMSSLISKFRNYSTPDGSFLGLEALKIGKKEYPGYALSQASKIKVFAKGTFLDPEKKIGNPNGKTIVFSLKENLKWDDGSPVTVDDFLSRIWQHADNNRLLIATKSKKHQMFTKFETDLIAEIEQMIHKFSIEELKKRIEKLINAKNNLIQSINSYVSAIPSKQTDGLYQKTVLSLNEYYNEYNNLYKLYKKFISLYDNFKFMIENGVVDQFGIQNNPKRDYENTIIKSKAYYDRFFTSFPIKLDKIKLLLRSLENFNAQLLLTKTNIPAFKFQYEQSIDVINRLNNVFVPSYVLTGKLLSSLLVFSKQMKRKKEEMLQDVLNSENIKIPLNYDFSRSENFINKLRIPSTFIPILKINNGDQYIRQDWNALSSREITNYCLAPSEKEREKINIDKKNLNFFTINGKKSYKTINDMCDNYTLIYKEKGELVFRLGFDIDLEEFFNILSSPEMYPIKSEKFNLNTIKERFDVQAKYSNGEMPYMANGAFSIKSINYDGITFKKNYKFWDQKSVSLNEFVIKYITNNQENALNDISSVNGNELIPSSSRNYFLDHYKGNNFKFQRFREGSRNLLFNIYDPYFTNGYFKRKIGSEIDWGLKGQKFIVNNYHLGKENECVIDNGTFAYPEKTYDNYLCGLIPEYREFASAMRVLFMASFNNDKFRKLMNLPLLHTKETFVPVGEFYGEKSRDYLDYVKDAVKYQNETRISINSKVYKSILTAYGKSNVKIEQRIARSTLPHSYGIMNIYGTSQTYSLFQGFYPTYKKIKKNAVERNDKFILPRIEKQDLEYPEKLWKSIVENVPKSWISNIQINLDVGKGFPKSQFALDESWLKNIKKVTKNRIHFNDKIPILYKIVDVDPLISTLENYFLELNTYLKKTSLDIDNIPRHIWKFFLKNIEAILEKNSTLLSSKKANLKLELKEMEKSLLEFNGTTFLKFTDYLRSTEYQKHSNIFKNYLFSQIEAFYLREGLIQPISGPREGIIKINVNAPFINNQFYDMTYAYFCNSDKKIMIRNRIQKDGTFILMTPPSCEEAILLRTLKKRLKNV